MDPLELLFARDVMRKDLAALDSGDGGERLASALARHGGRVQHLFPVVEEGGRFCGVVSLASVLHARARSVAEERVRQRVLRFPSKRRRAGKRRAGKRGALGG